MEATTITINASLWAFVVYFLKRTLDKVDSLDKSVNNLNTQIAVILTKDRRERIEDYTKERHNQ